jgi:hypothetical protein
VPRGTWTYDVLAASIRRRRLRWTLLVIAAVAAVVAALVFEPWKLVVDERVQGGGAGFPVSVGWGRACCHRTGRALARGTFISHNKTAAGRSPSCGSPTAPRLALWRSLHLPAWHLGALGSTCRRGATLRPIATF